MDLVLTLPASTAECERGFNSMKQIKNNWRSSLGVEVLNDLITFQLLSPDITKFNSQKAIDLWISSGLRQRRPNYMDQDEKDTNESDETLSLCVVFLDDIQSCELLDNDEQ